MINLERCTYRAWIVCLWFGLYSVGAVSETRVLDISIDQAYPPYMYTDNGQAMGLYPALITAVFKRMGYAAHTQGYPWKRALHLGATGQSGVGGIYMNEARLKVYDYSAPLYDEELVLYVKTGHGFAFRSIEDLRGKKVALNYGWSYGDVIDRARESGVFVADDSVRDNVGNFKKLIGGRVDCFVVDALAARKIILQQGYEGKVERLDNPISINAGYLVFSKTRNDQKLLSEFNRTLQTLRNEQAYDNIVDAIVKGKTLRE